jgi:hypothetical protein
MGGQAPRDDREENDVVDAQNNLKRGQREKGCPQIQVRQHLDHVSPNVRKIKWAAYSA